MVLNQDKDSKKDKRQLRVRKKERTKQEILKAAEEFFSDNPMSEVSIEDIAEAAFVSRTTVYNYFKNKDEIFFTVGTQTYEEANEFLENNFPSGLPGIEQVLYICEHGFRRSIERPLNNEIIRESLKHNSFRLYTQILLDYRNIPMEGNIGSTKFKELFETFEEPYLIKFYTQVQRNRDFWIRAVNNGKKDKTIRIDLEDIQILQFLYMLMMGIADQMELRKSILNRIRMDKETIIRNSLNLIALFLKNESSSLS